MDGDPVFAVLAQSALSLIFDEVVSARNGNEALQQLDDQEFDLVIVNLPGPQSDGVRLISRMYFKPTSHGVPVVGLLDAADTETAKAVAHFDIERMLISPLDLGEFVSAIVEIVRTRQQIPLCA